jgi:hypothetical protein
MNKITNNVNSSPSSRLWWRNPYMLEVPNHLTLCQSKSRKYHLQEFWHHEILPTTDPNLAQFLYSPFIDKLITYNSR